MEKHAKARRNIEPNLEEDVKVCQLIPATVFTLTRLLCRFLIFDTRHLSIDNIYHTVDLALGHRFKEKNNSNNEEP